MNLLQETIEDLALNDKSFDDVIFIGGNTFQISVDNFKAVADTEYDDGYGGQEVADDLTIIGDDFYMTRDEYDGSEQWEFHILPIKLGYPLRVIDALTVNQNPNSRCGWCTLEELNKEVKDENV
jgi:hypothetical protein